MKVGIFETILNNAKPNELVVNSHLLLTLHSEKLKKGTYD